MSLNGLFTNGIQIQGVRTQTPQRAPLSKWQTSCCFLPAKTYRSIGFRFHDTCSCENARRRGWRDSRLEIFEHRAGTLTHGGDHTGRVVRSEGEAGGRVHRRGRGQHVAGVAEG